MTKALVRIACALERIATALEARTTSDTVNFTYSDGAGRFIPASRSPTGDGGAGAPL